MEEAAGTVDTMRSRAPQPRWASLTLGGMARLSEEQIARELQRGEWRREGDGIFREWKLADFSAAMAFANRVAEAAEAANHHPDILVHEWNRVRLRLTTHSAGGLTQSDFELARTIDDLS